MSIPKIAKFQKVSFQQFYADWTKNCPSSKTAWTEDEVKEIYDNIKLPKRATGGSAGYDIFAPSDITIPFNQAKVIPTGIRCKIDEGWYLGINPRSGHGFKTGIHLANTVGIIDSDYFNADNEGHIMIKLVNDSAIQLAKPENERSFSVEAGKAFAQAIFQIYGITIDDETDSERTGGFGSTDAK